AFRPVPSVASILRATLLTKVLRIEPSLLRGSCAAGSLVFTCPWSSMSKACRQKIEARCLYARLYASCKRLNVQGAQACAGTDECGKGCFMTRMSCVAIAFVIAPWTAVAAPCPGNPDALGTERVLEVDVKNTPRVGRKQFPSTLPLREKELVLTFDDGP